MKNYFYVNEVIIKGAGLYVPPSDSKLSSKIFYLIHNAFWLIYSCIIFTFSEILAFKQSLSELNLLIKTANMVMTDILGDIKVVVWFYNRRRIMEILDILDSYAEIYEPYEDFVPERIIEKEKRIKNVVTLTFMVFAISVSLSSCGMAFRDLVVHTLNEEASASLDNLTLPYVSLVPFDYRKSAINFGCGIVYQMIPLYNYAWLIVGFDSIYMAMISYTSAHLLIIQGAFRTLRERCLVRLGIDVRTEFLQNPPRVQRAMDEEMKKITNHLQIVMETSKRIESIFTFLVLYQMISSLIILCTCLYMVSLTAATGSSAAKDFVYTTAVICQIYIYCYTGNKVSESSEGLSMAIFSMNWYGTTTSFKRSMIINMIRTQRGIQFTIGKFTPLTLTTFVTILRGSYSIFAVLKNSS